MWGSPLTGGVISHEKRGSFMRGSPPTSEAISQDRREPSGAGSGECSNRSMAGRTE